MLAVLAILLALAVLGALAEGASAEGTSDAVEYARDVSLDGTDGAVDDALAWETQVGELSTLETGDVGSSRLDGAEDTVDSGLPREAEIGDVDLACVDPRGSGRGGN